PSPQAQKSPTPPAPRSTRMPAVSGKEIARHGESSASGILRQRSHRRAGPRIDRGDATRSFLHHFETKRIAGAIRIKTHKGNRLFHQPTTDQHRGNPRRRQEAHFVFSGERLTPLAPIEHASLVIEAQL